MPFVEPFFARLGFGVGHLSDQHGVTICVCVVLKSVPPFAIARLGLEVWRWVGMHEWGVGHFKVGGSNPECTGTLSNPKLSKCLREKIAS